MNRSPGFSLIELLAVTAILAVLASAAIPIVDTARQRANEQELRQSLRALRIAIDRYKQMVDEGRINRVANGSGYPPTLDTLVRGTIDTKSPTASKLYFLRRVPADPMTEHDPAIRGDWGVRSYQSDANAPKRGSDVFDVYSKSDRIGLNGVPYAKW